MDRPNPFSVADLKVRLIDWGTILAEPFKASSRKKGCIKGRTHDCTRDALHNEAIFPQRGSLPHTMPF